MKRKLGFYILLFLPFAIHSQAFTDSFFVFRDTVYLQNRNLQETMGLYTAAKQDIENSCTGADLYLAFSHCEYLMGLFFRAEEQDNEAASYFEHGKAWAEDSLKLRPTSEGYRFLGANIAFLCDIRRSYGLLNYGKIQVNAKKAIELDPHNLAAHYLIAAQYVFAPWPLGNIKKGAALLEEITRQNYLSMDKENLFNLYLTLEAACLKQKKTQEAQIWHERASALYPTNNFISLLMK
jgi:tetratricopeptide (TPR) repeat protein